MSKFVAIIYGIADRRVRAVMQTDDENSVREVKRGRDEGAVVVPGSYYATCRSGKDVADRLGLNV